MNVCPMFSIYCGTQCHKRRGTSGITLRKGHRKSNFLGQCLSKQNLNPILLDGGSLCSWRYRIFSKIIPNLRGSIDSHIFGDLMLPVRFHCASTTLLLRSHYDNEDLTTLSLR